MEHKEKIIAVIKKLSLPYVEKQNWLMYSLTKQKNMKYYKTHLMMYQFMINKIMPFSTGDFYKNVPISRKVAYDHFYKLIKEKCIIMLEDDRVRKNPYTLSNKYRSFLDRNILNIAKLNGIQ